LASDEPELGEDFDEVAGVDGVAFVVSGDFSVDDFSDVEEESPLDDESALRSPADRLPDRLSVR
jgi:hypothetical protein